MTWQPGRDRIDELVEAGEIQRVTADGAIAQLLLEDAGRHLATAAGALSSGFEYPSTDAPGPSSDDVKDGITNAIQARDAAVTILEQDVLTIW